MAQRRRIVPDSSVLLPAFFPEKLVHHGSELDLSRRVEPLAKAIWTRSVEAFAPYLLVYEFMKGAHRKASGRSEQRGRDLANVGRLVDQFHSLPIVYVQPSSVLAEKAWDLMIHGSISPLDSWFVACAMVHDAELWISCEHADNLVENARRVHPNKVHVLVEERFA